METGVPAELIDRWWVRMQRAAALLQQRLDDPPNLAEIAAAAAVSPFHFHRIWRSLTGETLGETIRRLRIEAAQDSLVRTSANVTDTAMATGFGTPQSFARAFRKQVGVSPTQYRRDSAPAQEPPLQRNLVVDLVRRDTTILVALRREGQAYEELNETFGAVWSWAEDAGCLGDLEGIYGLPLDDPESVPEAELRYDAALAVGEVDPPAPFHAVTLHGGAYARIRHRGSYAGLEDATQHLVGAWLVSSEAEALDQPVVHHFLNDPDTTPEADLETEILLAVQTEGSPS